MLQDWNSLQKRQYTAARAVLAGSPQLLKITGRYNPSERPAAHPSTYPASDQHEARSG